MSEDRSSNEPEEKSWLEKIANAFSSEPNSREELNEILKVAEQNKVIDSDVVSIIDGALKVADQQVREIMVPRSQMVVIKAEQSLKEILPKMIKSSHSRFPVIGENVDEVLGILLAKDLLPQVIENDNDNFDITSLLRAATVVPESKRLNVLLREFRENRNHMAIVIDEYGGVAGLVTIEDVLEEIVGEIEDETDVEADEYIKKLGANDFIVKALTPIEDFNEHFNSDFSDEEFDTIGGIILREFGHLPRRNETTQLNGFEFKILSADSRQVHLLRMAIIGQDEED
ncbi:CBS domain-containing protein [Dasania sp. GY-MA-18]|uniref:Magnesium and cobalt efflux protein CorC n=1 Tax=Dasania phycosphaerae TaxID=2950436 RepID=A0A9J6RH49_9GAMM|nr:MULTISPECIES: transporter associated domain-containing protein [Dasania]MCR8921180.1 CBS domain-containing protein [Dasania sp. GY-MA-18]MCZ0863608.1 CBS domain-containing protein [Dasania phycosphaerae]MCZ0867336.1 CBS domain-containing protein [Dasania phycosphaerae]